MDEVISQIIEIEKQAKKLFSDSMKKSEEISDSLYAKEAQMERDISERTQKRIDIVKEEEEKRCFAQINDISDACAFQKRSLEEKYADHFDEWVDTVYNNVLNG